MTPPSQFLQVPPALASHCEGAQQLQGHTQNDNAGEGTRSPRAQVEEPRPKAVEPEPEVEEDEEDDWEDEEDEEFEGASSGVEHASDSEEEDDDDDDDGVDEEGMARLMKALGDDLDELAQVQISSLNDMDEDDEDEEEVEEDEEKAKAAEHRKEQVPVDEVDEVDDDAVFTRKVEVDNEVLALERIRETIALDSSLPWTETLVVTYPETIDVDVDDRSESRTRRETQLPFTRPADYFAEMVKSDSHMERIRQRLLMRLLPIKLSEDKRKQREGKKLGSRSRWKRHVDGDEEGGANVVDDGFDIQKAKMSRDSRDNKYGFGGGANRRSKQNTRESTDSFGSGAGRAKEARSAKGGAKGKPQRPGKSRRMNGRK
ncbi:Ebp2-domain-containing protein [Coprinellus micaceus]|uniref:Ebp2-domain-containing protein n=1 Tax=Coprinellus micaceus TaxID=71717 RepID=A0A4Y7R4E9_COPMI|nr:Ebp2-domain-containing protein [Coprinellus micaceus]